MKALGAPPGKIASEPQKAKTTETP